MTRHKKDPLRPFTEEERSWLERVSRSRAEPEAHVARAKALLAVADGQAPGVGGRASENARADHHLAGRDGAALEHRPHALRLGRPARPTTALQSRTPPPPRRLGRLHPLPYPSRYLTPERAILMSIDPLAKHGAAGWCQGVRLQRTPLQK